MSEVSDRLQSLLKAPAQKPKTTAAAKATPLHQQARPAMHLAPSLLQSTPWGQKALDLLLRPGEAGQALVNRGPGAGLQTLLHSESPQQAAGDFATNRAHFLTGMARLLGRGTQRGEDIYKRMPHVAQGATDLFLGMGLDPTSALGFSKAPAKLATMLDEHGLPLAMKAGAKLERRAGGLGTKVTKPLESLHTFFDVDAKTKRALATDAAMKGKGATWYENYAKLWGARNAAESTRNLALNALQKEYGRIMKGLSPQQEVLMKRAVNWGSVQNLAKRYPELAQRAADYKQWTDAVAHWRGSTAMQKQLGKQGFTLPKWAQPFSTPKARGLQRTAQYRPNYVPHLSDFTPSEINSDPELQKAIDASRARALSRIDLTKTASANLKRRAGTRQITLENLPEFREAEQAFMRSAARSISAKDLQRRVAATFSPTGSFKRVPGFVKEYLKPQAVSPMQEFISEKSGGLSDLARGATRLGASGLFYQPTPHMRNIAFMQLLSDPAALPRTLANYARLRAGFVSPEARARILEEPIAAGAVSAENAQAAETAGAGNALRKWIERAPGGKLVSAATKPIQALYGASQKMLWSFDDAAKAAQTARNIRAGMSPERAALEANLSLVNYNEKSPFTELAGYGAPFPTWRTKMPVAVARSVARNPQYAAALARLDPRLAGGQGPPERWQDPKKKSAITTPLGEVLGGLNDPTSYARGSMTTTLRELANLPSNYFERRGNPMQIEPGMAGSKLNYFTYGERGLPYALQQTPYVGQALDLAGKGTFAKKPGQAALEGLTGIRETFPARPAGKPTMINQRAQLFDLWQRKHPSATFAQLVRTQALINYMHAQQLKANLSAYERYFSKAKKP